MTTTETTTTEPNSTDTAPTPPGEDATDKAKSSREAAKYRTQLREAEGDAQRARELLEAEQTRAAERVLSDGIEIENGTQSSTWAMHDVTDLARFAGTEVSEFLDEAGQVDADKVAEAARALHTERPYLFVNKDAGRPPRASDQNRRDATPVEPRPSFEDAFKPRTIGD